MKNLKKLLWIALMFQGGVYAQELDTLTLDSMNQEPPAYYGSVFLDAAGFLAPVPSGVNSVVTFGLGLQYNQWIIMFSQSNFKGVYQQYVIFPNVFGLRYRHAGPTLGYMIHRDQWLSFLVKASMQWGDMVWEETDSDTNYFRDTFHLFQGSFQVEVNKLRFVKPYGLIGYQLVNDLQLTGLNQNDFNGVYFGVGLRFGYFNQ